MKITKIISYESRAILFWIFVFVCISSSIIYTYTLFSTVHYTAERQSLTRELSELSARVGDLEFKNIALRNEIDLEDALAMGFVEVKNPQFVERGTETLTLNTGKR